MQIILKTEDVTKHFGGIKALQGVSMQAEAGKITGLIGPNGSGKTTLFNIITGFIQPDKGSIQFLGTEISGYPHYKIARLGLYRTFQMSFNPQRMTVRENMLLCPQGQTGEGMLNTILKPGLVKSQEKRHLEKAREILELVNLQDMGDTLAGSLSGGQKKLLCLAQALMVNPKLILLDEPVAGVNPRLIDDILATIKQLQEQGQNFLIVEHNMKVIRQICDHVFVLDAGRIIAEGAPEETLQQEEVLRAYLAAPRSGQTQDGEKA